MKGEAMVSVICSWQRSAIRKALMATLGAIFLAGPVFAEPDVIRVGPIIWRNYEMPPKQYSYTWDILQMIGTRIWKHSANADDCGDFVFPLPGRQRQSGKTGRMNVVAQTLIVECRALFRHPPNTRVVPATVADGLTPEVILDVMDHAMTLKYRNEALRKALATFPGGVIECSNPWACQLTGPKDTDWEGARLSFDLLVAKDADRIVLVSQAYEGRTNFVYGVIWSDREFWGEVVEIIPDPAFLGGRRSNISAQAFRTSPVFGPVRASATPENGDRMMPATRSPKTVPAPGMTAI